MFLGLLASCAAMFAASASAAFLPFVCAMSRKKLQLTTAFGAGLLLGSAFIVIIPEGVEMLYENEHTFRHNAPSASHYDGYEDHDHDHDSDSARRRLASWGIAIPPRSSALVRDRLSGGRRRLSQSIGETPAIKPHEHDAQRHHDASLDEDLHPAAADLSDARGAHVAAWQADSHSHTHSHSHGSHSTAGSTLGLSLSAGQAPHC